MKLLKKCKTCGGTGTVKIVLHDVVVGRGYCPTCKGKKVVEIKAEEVKR